jgi:aryl-alcohol dehydrogenase-like predicted oxidoreductase
MPTERHAMSMLHAAYDLGISALDTAPDYGNAEQRVGAFLRDHNLHEEVAICTKLPALAAVETRRIAQYVEDALTASLRRLCADVVDTYLVHDVADITRHGEALIAALCQQRDKGRALSIGACVSSPEELAVLEEYPELGVVEHPFSLLDRRLLDGGWPERLTSSGTRLQVRSALLEGLLALPPEKIPAALADARPALTALREVLGRFALSPVSAALPYALAIDPDSVIVAADTLEQLEAFVKSASMPLPEALFAAIDEECPEAPATVIDPRRWPRV